MISIYSDLLYYTHTHTHRHTHTDTHRKRASPDPERERASPDPERERRVGVSMAVSCLLESIVRVMIMGVYRLLSLVAIE